MRRLSRWVWPLAAVLLLASLTVTVARMLLREPPGAARLLRVPPPTPAQAAGSLRRVDRMTRRVKALRQKPEAEQPEPFSLRVTESDLNAYLRASPRARRELRRHGLDDVVVSVREEGLQVLGRLTLAGRQVWLLAEGQLEITPEGQLDFAPSLVQVGRLPVLPALARRAVTRLRDDLRGHLLPPDVRLRTVTTGHQWVMARGEVLPDRRDGGAR